MVLNKDSSILGYEGEVSNFLIGNHHDVCKFADQDDPNYITVRNVLKTLVTRFRNASKPCYAPHPSRDTNNKLEGNHVRKQSPEELQKIQTLLAVTERPDDDLKFFHDRWTTGTCDWIKYETSFKDWMKHNSRSKVLWLHGPPATGKSVLSSFIIEYLDSLDISCSFFFFRFGDQSKRSTNSLLRSLAYQTANQLPSFKDRLRNLHDDGLHFEKSDARTIWNKVFVGILFKMDVLDPLYWVVDALDECDSSQHAVGILSGISSAPIPIRLLMISRYTEPISSAFDRYDMFEDFHAQPIEAQESDIYTYVRKELHYLKLSEASKQRVLEGIKRRASNNFLWVNLAMKEIRKCYTEAAIEQALEDIPIGMEDLYKRMEMNIARDLREGDKNLAKLILIWATCARRGLSLAELSQALEPDFPAVLDLRHAIGEVCGHFVVVDNTEHVAMIHQTARKYLTKTSNLEFSISAPDAHCQLFHKTLSFLLDTSLRAKLEQIAAIPAAPFLEYAITCWPYHLNQCSSKGKASPSILGLLVRFLRGSYVLTWIHALGHFDQLSILVQASKHLNTFVGRMRRYYADDIPSKQPIEDMELLDSWASDLLKLFAKFGPNLRQQPNAIHKLIPPFCPKSSVIYQQFGRRDQKTLSVTGLTNPSWDDCLAKISLGEGLQALQMICVGHYFWILATAGVIILCDALSLRELRRVEHEEFVFAIACSASGERMVSYGFHTTKIWSIPHGHLKYEIQNPKDCKALNALAFTDGDMAILLGSDDKTIRRLDLARPKEGWQILHPKLLKSEAPMADTNTNIPRYMQFSPDTSQVAVAYRGYPLSVWSLAEKRSIATLRRNLGKRKHNSTTWTAVDRVRWHPKGGEILGLYNDGCVFKWNLYDEDTNEVRARASEIDMSSDGVVFATSDIGGLIKIWNYEHFAMIYQLSCDNGITGLCFSPDCRRIYDLSGSVCNAWEPNVLIRLTELEERASEKQSEAGSTALTVPTSEAYVESTDPVTALDVSTPAMLYCAGNDAGVVHLYDFVGSKTEIYRSPRFLTIDQLHFSQDGGLVAFCEIGGQVVVMELLRTDSRPDQVEARLLCELKIMDGVHQLLITPDGKRLHIDGAAKSALWDLENGSCINESPGNKDRHARLMINHPMDGSMFFDCYVVYAEMCTWDETRGLEGLRKIPLAAPTPRLSVSSGPDHSDPFPFLRRRSSPAGIRQAEIVSSVDDCFQSDGRHIVIHTTQTLAGSREESNIVIMDTASLLEESGTNPAVMVEIPASVVATVRKPLGFHDRSFQYLDNESWMCTWDLDADNDVSALERHFFIPRDWLNSETIDLCMLMSNGTFVCPHYGEVAVIHSSLSQEW